MRSSDNQPLPPAYWRLWTASGISNLGDGVFLVALPLLAARLTRSEISISLVAAAAMLPWLVLSLPIGALIDRSDRRQIMIMADTARAVVVAGLAVAVALDVADIWLIWIVALALGTAEVFFDNASQAIVPAIVPMPLLEKANGRRYAVELAANTFIGTPLGSLLFAVSLALPFGVDAATFAIAVALVLSIRGNFNPNTQPRHETASIYAEMRTGIRWLWRDPLLRTVAISLGLSNLAFQMPQAVFVLFAQDELAVSERGFGFLLAVMGAGAVLGGLVGDRIVARLGQAASIYTALVIWIATLLAVGTFPVAWFVALAVAIESMAATVWNVVMVSLRQQVIPAPLFGRVNSVYRWVGWGTLPIGSVLGGLIAHAYGLRATYFVGAAVMVVALLVAMRHVSTASIVRALAGNWAARSQDDTPVARFGDDLFEF
ncbi:MAG: MFS transporter [Actinomycetota bacterium]|jgi:MFS family permease|nr:MAG: antibiotic efflux protein [Acidimicrobiaceae bacterium]